MSRPPFHIYFDRFPQILGEGAVIERLRRETDFALDTHIVNCTHASIFKAALFHDENSSDLVRKRIRGLLANTAALKPEELDNREHLLEEAPQTFGQSVGNLYRDLGMKILGGCCGTDDRHIRQLAKRLAELQQ